MSTGWTSELCPEALVIAGTTGMVGGYALEHAAVERVTFIGRRKLDFTHPRLTEILHPDFEDSSARAETRQKWRSEPLGSRY
jgi:hypothetical protein